MVTSVHIEHMADVGYPQWDDASCYGPSEEYPEFIPKNNILSSENKVFGMIRNTIAALGMDRENFGKREWNPFSDFIKPGETVLVKPNMVCHENGNKNGGIDCLVTHPSIVRTVLDYVVLALKGSGNIILADAPVQGCDFELLVKELHYDKIVAYYQKQNIQITLLDLRQLGEAGIEKKKSCFAADEDVVVDMGGDSAFGCSENLRITNYLPEYLEEYHNAETHKYSVAKAVMDADVIINLPKPKTHRKAGMTASLKNMVGCVAKKECLPHHTKGSKKEKGDEYLKQSVLKKWRTILIEKNDRRMAEGRKKSKFYDIVEILLYKASKIRCVDEYTEGSWYGNDTLWRTICDINRVVMYADKRGNLTDRPQRKMFILADMIIAGEGEGPLCPSPKQVGILVGGWEQIAVDKVISALMGFLPEYFPSIQNAAFGIRYRLPENEFLLSANEPVFLEKDLDEIRKEAVPFIPTSGWTERLETSV